MRMKQVIKYKDVGLLNIIRRTDPVIRGYLLAEDLCLNHLEEITGGQITPNEVLGTHL